MDKTECVHKYAFNIFKNSKMLDITCPLIVLWLIMIIQTFRYSKILISQQKK